MGIAAFFLLGFEIPSAERSIPPNIDEDLGPSLPELALPTDEAKLEVKEGVNAGASGRKVGPDAEKLNSL